MLDSYPVWYRDKRRKSDLGYVSPMQYRAACDWRHRKTFQDYRRSPVSKFDKETHEYVEGAEFQIIEEATGKVVATWTTGKEAEAFERMLNVDTKYILRETKAPEGYDTAADTVFIIGEYGDLTVISGDDAEVSGKYSLDVYDVLLDSEKNQEIVEKSQRVVKTSSTLGKTGDSVPFAIVGGVVGVSAIALAVLLHRKRRA